MVCRQYIDAVVTSQLALDAAKGRRRRSSWVELGCPNGCRLPKVQRFSRPERRTEILSMSCSGSVFFSAICLGGDIELSLIQTSRSWPSPNNLIEAQIDVVAIGEGAMLAVVVYHHEDLVALSW